MMSFCVMYLYHLLLYFLFFFFKQKTAYEMRISDWSSDVCSSDLAELLSLGADSALTIVKARDIEDGARNYRYQQTYRGIPVYGEPIVVSAKANGQERALFGRQVQGLAAEVTAIAPQGPAATAQARATRAHRADERVRGETVVG